MKAGDFFSRALGAFVIAASMLGLFAVTGFPEPMGRQVFIAVGTAVIVQSVMAVYYRRGSGNS